MDTNDLVHRYEPTFCPSLTLQDTRSHLLDLHFGSNHYLSITLMIESSYRSVGRIKGMESTLLHPAFTVRVLATVRKSRLSPLVHT